MFRPLPLLAWAAFTAICVAHAEEKNAAVLYQQAAEQLPKLERADREVLYPLDAENRIAYPLSPEARELLASLQPSLKQLSAAAQAPECRWEHLPSLSFDHSHTLLPLPLASAFLHIEEGREREAVRELRSALFAMRRIRWESTPVIAAILVDTWESIDYRATAQLLHRLSPEALAALDEVITTLPSSLSLAEATQGCLNDPILSQLIERLRSGQLTEADETLLASTHLPRDADAVAQIVNDYHADLRALAPILARPFPAAFHDTLTFLDALEKKRGEDHLSCSFLSSYRSAIKLRFKREIENTLLRAAIAIQRHGLKALEQTHDPATGKPFLYQESDAGFTLSSGLKKPAVSLFVPTPADTEKTAATLYHKAIRNTPLFTDEESRLIRHAVGNWSNPPVSLSHDEARALLQRYERPLADFAEAIRLLPGGTLLSPHGIRGSFDHQEESIQLLQLVLLQSRIQVADKDFTGALESYRQTLAMADGITSSSPGSDDLSMRYIAHSRLIRVIAVDLPRLDEPSLRLLAEQLEFPTDHPFRLAAITSEQAFWADQIDIISSGYSLTAPFADGFFHGIAEAVRRFPQHQRSRKRINEIRLDIKDRRYLTHLLSLPAPERNKKLEDRLVLLRPDPVTGIYPTKRIGIGDFLLLNASFSIDVGFQMIRAAIAIYLEGEEALSRFIDPSNDQLFRYEKTSTGFRLHSEFMGVDPISLTFEP